MNHISQPAGFDGTAFQNSNNKVIKLTLPPSTVTTPVHNKNARIRSHSCSPVRKINTTYRIEKKIGDTPPPPSTKKNIVVRHIPKTTPKVVPMLENKSTSKAPLIKHQKTLIPQTMDTKSGKKPLRKEPLKMQNQPDVALHEAKDNPSDIKKIDTNEKEKHETRLFIKKQQMLRKLNSEKAKENKTLEKIQIKKRLNELQTKTRTIVKKNVKNISIVRKTSEKSPTILMKNEQKLVNNETTTIEVEPQKLGKKLNEKSSIIPSPSLIPNLNLVTIPMKIGILRKLTDANTGIATDVTQKFVTGDKHLITSPPRDACNTQISNGISMIPDEIEIPTMKLSIPSVLSPVNTSDVRKYVSPQPASEKETRIPEEVTQHQHDANFWLKPTGAQIYPYNFLMAIRKKLDNTRTIVRSISTNTVSNDQTDQISGHDVVPHRSTTPKQMTVSPEINTNYSSVSLNLQDAEDTTSEVSSLQSDYIKSSKSAVNACSTKIDYTKNGTRIKSPNDVLSPLSIENVSKLNLHTKRQRDEDPHSSRPLNQDSKRYFDPDFRKLLESFNENLKHVIEVNNKLYESIRNPPKQIIKNLHQHTSESSLSPQTQNSSKATKSYNTDFEMGVDESNVENVECNSSKAMDVRHDTTSRERSGSEKVVANKVVPQTFEKSVYVPSLSLRQSDETLDEKMISVHDNQSMISSSSSWGGDISGGGGGGGTQKNFNCSSIGLYDQLINTETTKSENLILLMKIREKSQFDRLLSQIACLELQKTKLKDKLRFDEIPAIKKKQRAILLKLKSQRGKIQEIINEEKQLNKSRHAETSGSGLGPTKINLDTTLSTSFTIRKSTLNTSRRRSSSIVAVKGFELDEISGQNLERMLEQRELELRQRRQKVERLLQLHQNLDNEEAIIKKMEQKLLKCYNNQLLADKSQKVLEIERSISILKQISPDSDETGNVTNKSGGEKIIILGSKLNKLWHRLTGLTDVRFDAGKKFEISKVFLENLYEEAKQAVLAASETKTKIENFESEKSFSIKITSSSAELSSVSNSTTFVLSKTQISPIQGDEILDQHTNTSAVSVVQIHTTNEITVNDTGEIEEHEKSYNTTVSNQLTDKTTTTNETKPSEDIDDHALTSVIQSIVDQSVDEILDEVSFPVYNETINYSQLDDDKSVSQYFEEQSISVRQDKVDDENITESIVEQTKIEDQIPDGHTTSFADTFESIESVQSIQTRDDEGILSIKNDDENVDDEIEELSATNQTESPVTSSSIQSTQNPITVENEIEQRLINLDRSLKELDREFEKIPPHLSRSPRSKESESNSSSSLLDTSDESKVADEENVRPPVSPVLSIVSPSASPLPHQQPTSSSSSSSPTGWSKNVSDILPVKSPLARKSMPDIINEAEGLRQQQQQQQQQTTSIQQILETVETIPPVTDSQIYLREIPNKPPPPYVPPAHNSQFALVFPSESRINEIVYRRTGEIFTNEFPNGHQGTDKIEINVTPITTENITNIYERVIIDICREVMTSLRPDHKNSMLFFNPPDRLQTVQQFVCRTVHKILMVENRGQITQSPPPSTTVVLTPNGVAQEVNNQRKHDVVNDILKETLAEEENRWTNFEVETCEVKSNVVDQILAIILDEALSDFEGIFLKL